MRILAALLLAPSLSLPALAQCEVDRLVPTSGYAISGSLSMQDGVAVLAADGQAVNVFEAGPQGWVQTASFVSEGWSLFEPMTVTNDGDTIVTGVQEANNLAGGVWLYERSTNYAVATPLVQSQPLWADSFGSGLALAGDTLVVGASMMVNDIVCGPGRAFVFERAPNGWVEAAVFAPHGQTDPMGGYGIELDTDGRTVVIGAFTDDEAPIAQQVGVWSMGVGAAYVYEEDANGAWYEAAKVFPSNGEVDDLFGRSVAVQGTTMLIGASGRGAGAVYVFERAPAGWVEVQVLTPSDGQPLDGFGRSVALDGNRAVVGADFVDDVGPNNGALYHFERVGGQWVERDKLLPAAGSGAYFGSNVALDGNRALWTGFWGAAHAHLHSLGVADSARECLSTPTSSGVPATITAGGCDSVLGNGLRLDVAGVPPGQPGLVYFAQDAQQTPLWNGYLCLAAPFERLPFGVADGAGVLSTAVDFHVPPADLMAAGSTWRFQAFFRDPGVGAGVNSSDAVRVLLQD
jgi:hypothetical protein